MVTKKKMDPMLKALIWFCIIFAIVIFTTMGILLAVFVVDEKEFETLPEQTAQVEVVEKATSSSSRRKRIHFKFEDGSEKYFKVDDSIYRNTQIGDTGVLVYKETQRSKNIDGRLFISFENNAERSYIPPLISSWQKVFIFALCFFIPFFVFHGMPYFGNRKWLVRQFSNLKKRFCLIGAPISQSAVSVFAKSTEDIVIRSLKKRRGFVKKPRRYFYVSFVFPDNSKKKFEVDIYQYQSIFENGIGILTYKEKSEHLLFISFQHSN